MINERIFLGFPVWFKDICQVYPPTVNEVIGNLEYNRYISLFTMTQEELDDAYADVDKRILTPTPFQYLLLNYHNEAEMKKVILNAFSFFLHEPVTVVPEMEIIIIGKSEEELDPDVDLINPRMLDKDNYFEFQNNVRMAMGMDAAEPPDPDEDPRVKRIKAKGRRRERMKAKKKSSIKMGTLLAAICCMGIGLNPLNIGEMSYANVSWLIQMYKQQESYDIDIRAIMAGADSKKIKPKYWIKNLE